jgi:hypothetical protein
VVNRNAKASRDDGSQSAIGVAENQQPVRAMLKKQCFALFQYLPNLSAEAARPHAHVNVRLANLQLVKEHPAQPVIVVLTGVNQDMLAELIEKMNNETQPDDLRPSA